MLEKKDEEQNFLRKLGEENLEVADPSFLAVVVQEVLSVPFAVVELVPVVLEEEIELWAHKDLHWRLDHKDYEAFPVVDSRAVAVEVVVAEVVVAEVVVAEVAAVGVAVAVAAVVQ